MRGMKPEISNESVLGGVTNGEIEIKTAKQVLEHMDKLKDAPLNIKTMCAGLMLNDYNWNESISELCKGILHDDDEVMDYQSSEINKLVKFVKGVVIDHIKNYKDEQIRLN
tara:strand:- start:13 stop:345 length:333 start_codon:yes stop_codon:yes gene_type:complete